MWPFKQPQPDQEIARDVPPPHPLALRIYEIEQSLERGFWDCNGGRVSGAFSVVARMLAEQEDRIEKLEAALGA